MSRRLLLIWPLLLSACIGSHEPTIASLRNQRVEIRAVPIEGGLEKAMEGYRRFLEETPASAMSPEAIRRLADLKIEREYGTITADTTPEETETGLPAPEPLEGGQAATASPSEPAAATESEVAFEQRATAGGPIAATAAGSDQPLPGGADLEKAGALEAIALYQRLLDNYPFYERNDQVLYQMSRAYEELGRVDEAMEVMNRLVRDYPNSRYIDEVQFRRGEYFFTRRHYLDAEDAYKNIVDIGISSTYFQLALYKLGWTFYKQELYDEALHRFVDLLDTKVAAGYDFAQTTDEIERKRMDDTFRVISLGFSYLGGADAVVDFFSNNGKRSFEDEIYSNLGEYYYDKRRYSDAVATFNAFVSRNPYHEKAPLFQMRVIEINMAGGFPSLVIDAKKAFCSTYGLKGEYWNYFDPASRPEVLGFLKTNLTDLANHYHALYRNKRMAKEKGTNFSEALHWYREFLDSFPQESESPTINYQLADLLLENRNFADAAIEYEKTAYDYPRHEKAATAGYSAVYAFRQHLAGVAADERNTVKREVVRSSLKFAETFPEHDKAPIVLGAATDDLFDMEDYPQALAVARQLITTFPNAEAPIRRGAWLVAGHSAFKLEQYADAEAAYVQVLTLLPEQDKARPALVDNLAAAIYKQGEQARANDDFRLAAEHFLRVGVMAPTSKFRPTAEYDAAAALIQLQDWPRATEVLLKFRDSFPGHELQPEVTKKVAYVYRESGQLALAAGEFERVEREANDDEVRREALQIAAQLYGEAGDKDRALEVYRRYVAYFPQPLELNLETRDKIVKILKEQDRREDYLVELRQIVAIEKAGGEARTPRTRYLAGSAALALAEVGYETFASIKLVKPFKDNLAKKQKLMKSSTREFTQLLEYKDGVVTAAATFYLAEIYANLSRSLMASERPEDLSPLEMEQYELALEDQAYPFEEKAITVHKSNLELITVGVYNLWVDRSLQKLAKFFPANYHRPEEVSGVLTTLDHYLYARQLPGAETGEKPYVPSAATAAAVEAVVHAAEAAAAAAADLFEDEGGGPARTVEAPAEAATVEAPAEAATVEAPAEAATVEAPAEATEPATSEESTP